MLHYPVEAGNPKPATALHPKQRERNRRKARDGVKITSPESSDRHPPRLNRGPSPEQQVHRSLLAVETLENDREKPWPRRGRRGHVSEPRLALCKTITIIITICIYSKLGFRVFRGSGLGFLGVQRFWSLRLGLGFRFRVFRGSGLGFLGVHRFRSLRLDLGFRFRV
jgi:hypothetical protein